jgi:hypothetical protein
MKKRSKKEALRRFETYSQGIKRLEELERELNSISTLRFRKQEEEIRKKLKNVSLIPEIENDIRKLRLQIAGIKVDESSPQLNKIQQKEIDELKLKESSLEETLPQLYKKIEALEDELKKSEIILKEKDFEKRAEDENKAKKLAFMQNLMKIRNQQVEEENKNVPKMEKRLTKNELNRQRKMEVLIRDAFSLPKTFKPLNLAEDLTEKKPLNEVTPPKIKAVKNKVIPIRKKVLRKKFMPSEEFHLLSNGIRTLKNIFSHNFHEVSGALSSKYSGDKEILSVLNNFKDIKENLKIIKTNFSFKIL